MLVADALKHPELQGKPKQQILRVRNTLSHFISFQREAEGLGTEDKDFWNLISRLLWSEPIDSMPLYINDRDPYPSGISKWRLKIGK